MVEWKNNTRICISYDNALETGNFRGYIDDISIYEGDNDVYRFIGNGNWNVAANWSNQQIPPTPLTNGYIFIDPLPDGECVLNVDQTVTNKRSIIVNTNKKLRITGSLQIQ